jgi:hypothetical protein
LGAEVLEDDDPNRFKWAWEGACQAASVSDAQITNCIYVDVKGVALNQPQQRIVI